MLAVDAFSSDSIPIHLLTDECFSVYQKHLKADGILLFHISNRFIDLKPVLFATSRARGLTATYIQHEEEFDDSISGSDWILVSNEKVANLDRIKSGAHEYNVPESAPRWTDDFASLAPVINWSFGVSWDKLMQKAKQNAKKK